MNKSFFDRLQSRGWKIERYEGMSPGVPEALRRRYPAAEQWLSWIGGVKSAFSGDEAVWLLCAEDCKGLCRRCGAKLNLGPCGCKPEIDPRLAALGRLLDKGSAE